MVTPNPLAGGKGCDNFSSIGAEETWDGWVVCAVVGEVEVFVAGVCVQAPINNIIARVATKGMSAIFLNIVFPPGILISKMRANSDCVSYSINLVLCQYDLHMRSDLMFLYFEISKIIDLYFYENDNYNRYIIKIVHNLINLNFGLTLKNVQGFV